LHFYQIQIWIYAIIKYIIQKYICNAVLFIKLIWHNYYITLHIVLQEKFKKKKILCKMVQNGDGEPSTVALLHRTVEGARISDSFATGNFRPLTSVRG